MKINKMWAMFNKNGILYRWTVEDTRRDVINRVERDGNHLWPHYYRRGYRITRVAVLPIDAAGDFLLGGGNKP